MLKVLGIFTLLWWKVKIRGNLTRKYPQVQDSQKFGVEEILKDFAFCNSQIGATLFVFLLEIQFHK